MRKVHLIFGVLAAIAFLLTGQYMDKYYNHMVGVPDGPRLLYRTRHIFILLSGLVNLAIAAYFIYRRQPLQRTLKLIAICFALSGGTGLIYEVLWARMLGLVFGATTVAISAVLAAFMGGLALGSWLAANSAAKVKRPLRVYAFLEIAVGLYAL